MTGTLTITHQRSCCRSIRKQRGMMAVTLLILVAVLMLGLSAANIAIQGEKSARGGRDKLVAFAAAELALADAERAISSSDVSLVDDSGGRFHEFGAHTGGRMRTGTGTLSARLPRYCVERVILREAGGSASKPSYAYRITAIGFGTNEAVQVALQSYYTAGKEND